MSDFYDVVGVGVPYLDFVVRVAEVPTPNQSAPIAGFQLAGGGKVPTALVAASRLGLSTALVAALAGDSFGTIVREDLVKEGLSLRYAAATEHSAISIVLADEHTKSRTIMYSESDVPETAVFDGEAGMDLEARLLLISASGPAEQAAISWAKRKNIPIMLDADYYDPAFAGMAKDMTLFIGSEHYFHAYAPELDLPDKLRAIHNDGPQTVIVTQGERGCMLLDRQGLRTVPAFEVDVVDTTGAGDVFHGAFAYAYLQNWNAYESAVFASAVSGLKCRHAGGRAGIPDLQEVTGFLQKNERSVQSPAEKRENDK